MDQANELRRRLLERYRSDPGLFALEVLHTKTWRRQREILTAVAEHRRVAVRSGHKCGKTTALAILAIWWVCTRPRARVILTAASWRQVLKVLWPEIKRLARRSSWPLGGELHDSPETGWTFPDGREILGFSTREPENMAGFSGPSMLFIVDEASGVPDAIFEAIEGNEAGGARIAMISNPTKTSGIFYDAFTSERSDWHCIHISSEECAREAPKELGEGTGLATASWVEAKRKAWGVGDPRWDVRVQGQFPKQDDHAAISLALVEAAKQRWPSTPCEGPLRLGVDVAGFGTDYTSIVWARGRWASRPTKLKGYDPVQVAGEVMKVVRLVARPGERAEVRIDISNMGLGVAAVLREGGEVDVVGFQAAESATLEGFSRMRDQMWGALEAWLKDRGAIPDDKLLASDLTAPRRGYDLRQRVKIESKRDLKKRIGRSTDDADALALAVFPTPGRHDDFIYGQEFEMPKGRFADDDDDD
jgi:hypothetical protein